MPQQQPRKFFSSLPFVTQLVVIVQGIIVFASVMGTLGLQVLLESGRQLITKVRRVSECKISYYGLLFVFIVNACRSTLLSITKRSCGWSAACRRSRWSNSSSCSTVVASRTKSCELMHRIIFLMSSPTPSAWSHLCLRWDTTGGWTRWVPYWWVQLPALKS